MPCHTHSHTHTHTHLYTDDPSARVRGNVVHGVFEGAVVCDEDVYHIEPAQR